MKNKIAIMLDGKPMLPGTLAEYYNVCGKTPCRCKDKKNPQKHGPYYQLSYSLRGKNSSISVKKDDVALIRAMTENYREHVLNTQDLGIELLALYKKEGCQVMLNQYDQLVEHEIDKISGRKPKSRTLEETSSSRDKWKSKAMERQAEINKLNVKIRDLSKSRDNWKSKTKRQKVKNHELSQELEKKN